MALKDLVASRSALSEEAVEAIIGNFVRYDTDEIELVLLPEFTDLPNSHKILVFLSALQGWRFVVDSEHTTSMKPSEIEEKTGIPGGSLRPALRTLAQQKLLGDKDGAYFVRPAALPSIKKEIEGNGRAKAGSATPHRTSRGSKTAASSRSNSVAQPLRKPAKKSGSTLQGKFDSLIENGFFGSARTLKDLEIRFHEEAVIVRKTSLPNLLLGGVTAGKLKRTKADVNGRTVWVYSNKVAAS